MFQPSSTGLYPANDGIHKYYIITNSGKKTKIGVCNMSDFTISKNTARKQKYTERHQKIENWTKSGIDTAG